MKSKSDRIRADAVSAHVLEPFCSSLKRLAVLRPIDRELRAVSYQPLARSPSLAALAEPTHSSPDAKRCPIFNRGSAVGYHLCPPFDATVTWLGSKSFRVDSTDQLGQRLWAKIMEELTGKATDWWCSKIDGVFQIDPGQIFATPEGVKLLVTQPFNMGHQVWWTHTGLLDSDWFWVPSTINIEFCHIGASYEFRRDSPIAQLIPLCSADNWQLAPAAKVEQLSAGYLTLWRQYVAMTHGGFERDGSQRIRRGVYRQLERVIQATNSKDVE